MPGWNSFDTGRLAGMTCQTIEIAGANGDKIHAYTARPEGKGPFPGVVLVHHMPGWDELYMEWTRRFAQHGYNAICTDLYERSGHGKPDDIRQKAMADGGIADAQVLGDTVAAQKWLRALPTSNGKVGIIGSCSGGRHVMMVAGKSTGWDAIVDLWGGGVVQDKLDEKRPQAPIDMTKDVSGPVLGIFGNDDQNPTPAQVDQHEAELKKHGKRYEFHRYDGAGHGFFYYHRPAYRAEAASDAWEKIYAFFDKELA